MQRDVLPSPHAHPAKLTNVRLAGRYAHVTGTRARYRVHLGSGVIHVEPTGTLVLRAEPVQPITAPLPYADGDDGKAPEIVAKVLLLADDAAIDDPALLAQLSAGGAVASPRSIRWRRLAQADVPTIDLAQENGGAARI